MRTPRVPCSLRPAACLLATLLIAAAGCSSRSPEGPPGSPGPGSPPPGDLPPTGVDLGPSALSAEQRDAALGRAGQEYERVLASGVADPLGALATYLAAQPEFEAAGVEDGSVWARFSDGRPVLFLDNFDGTVLQGQAVSAPPSRTLSAMGTNRVPGGRTALLTVQALPDTAGHGPTMDAIAASLDARNYTVAQVGTVDVRGLRVGARDLGVFYFHGHAGKFFWRESDERGQFALLTDTPVNETNEQAFADDIREGRLIYTWARSRRQDPDVPSNPGRGRYALTSHFVRAYFQLAPRALVYLNACAGGGEAGSDMRAAFVEKGAGVVLGYDGNTTAWGYAPAAYFFDRTLGGNASEPPDPPGRVFRIDEVFAEMAQKRHGDGVDYLTDPQNGSKLVMFGAGTRMLAPNIKVLRFYEDTMGILADLPAGDSVVVKVGDQVLPHSEQGDELHVQLPQGVSGAVVVEVDGIRSNPRPIVSWRGPITYEQPIQPGATGTLFRVTYEVHLRADPYGLREEVDGPLEEDRVEDVTRPRSFIAATDTTARYECSGSLAGDTFSGSGELVRRFPPLEGQFAVTGYVHPTERRLRLLPNFFPVRCIFNAAGGGTVEVGVAAPAFEFQETQLVPGREHVPWGWFAELDDDFSIQAKTFVGRLGDLEVNRIRWPRMQAQPARDPQVGR